MKTLDLYITKVCNLNCEYCYVDLVNNEQSFEYNNFIERVDLLKYDHIKFFWWEPLLKRNDIVKVILWVKEKKENTQFTIVTNWILLNKEKLNFCIKENIEVVFSLHYKGLSTTLHTIQQFLFAKKILGFSLIFEENHMNFPYKIICLLQKIGFTKFILTPEVYSKWDEGNILLLEEQLDKLEQLFIMNRNIEFKWIGWEYLKEIVKWCEKTIIWKKGDVSLCNRFKDLDKLNQFNYKYIYDKYDEIINLDSNKNKWFYICPIWWFLDSLNIDQKIEKRIIQFKNLNELFISFYKKINNIQWKLNFLSDDINEIRFNLTSQCNIRCEYCYVDFKDEVLSEEKAKNIIEFFILQNGKEKNISFFWWEPLLEFNLLKKLVVYAMEFSLEKKKKINFTIATNFLLINDEKIRFFEKHNFNIHISLNWERRINNMMRDNSTDLLLTKLSKYSEEFWKDNITILLAFSNSEVSQLYWNCKFIYDLGYTNINLEIIFWHQYSWDKRMILTLQSELYKIKQSGFYKKLYLSNLSPNNKFLDISVKGKTWENSFDFHNYDANFKVKQLFNKIISNVFNK